jgi:Flp pilus assembly protein TadB
VAQTGARAKARAERERLAAQAAEERAARAARSASRRARRERLTGWVPARRSRPVSALAERRRRNVRILIVVLLLLNALVYLVTEDVGTVAFSAIASVLVAPVVYTLLFRR